MGNSNSVETKNKSQDEKIFNIETTGNRLNRIYTEKYLDPDFCNQVTMINNDELIRFHHQKVNGKSYSFGYIGDVPQIKETICEGIQEEYRLKKELVNEILGCFRECNSRINSVTRGPICRGNPEIFNEVECSGLNQWLDKVAPPDSDIGENKKWYTTLDEMHAYFMKNITVLENILIDLDNHDDSFSIDKINTMLKIVEKIKQGLNIECSRFQRYILTIPTYTQEELMDKAKIDIEKSQLSEAKKNALLDGRNLKI